MRRPDQVYVEQPGDHEAALAELREHLIQDYGQGSRKCRLCGRTGHDGEAIHHDLNCVAGFPLPDLVAVARRRWMVQGLEEAAADAAEYKLLYAPKTYFEYFWTEVVSFLTKRAEAVRSVKPTTRITI